MESELQSQAPYRRGEVGNPVPIQPLHPLRIPLVTHPGKTCIWAVAEFESCIVAVVDTEVSILLYNA